MSILKVFLSYFHAKFQPIQVDDGSLRRLANCTVKCVTPETCAATQEPITLEELHIATTQGKSHKSPGQGRICSEFFKTAWDVVKHDLLQIINLVYIEGKMTARQLQGLIVCLPKETNSQYVEDYRPLALLNTDLQNIGSYHSEQTKTMYDRDTSSESTFRPARKLRL